MRFRRKVPTLIDEHLFLDVLREDDAREQIECQPPDHEVVEWHLTYVAEAYLPSHAEQLRAGLAEANWADDMMREREDVVPSLRSSPFGGGWTNLGILVPASDRPWPGVRRAELPDGIASVWLSLWSATSSLTVLVATFEWDDYWGEALDRIARTPYQTAAIPMGNGRIHYGPFDRMRLESRGRRREMHRRVSSWLASYVPGAFAERGSALPTLDVVTTAQARPFQNDPPLKMYDYREALDLDRRFGVATSTSLPAWRLALADRDAPNVLTLAARTAEVFDERILGGYGGEVSRWGMANYLSHRVEDLVCSWASVRLLEILRVELASVRDRSPAADESAGKFARRLAHDVDQLLRRGADAAAVCADISGRPERAGPLGALSGLDFVVPQGVHEPRCLKDSWTSWLTELARMIERMEAEQQRRLSTSAELSGLVLAVRTQDQMRLLTLAAVVIAVVAVIVSGVVGVLQLSSG